MYPEKKNLKNMEHPEVEMYQEYTVCNKIDLFPNSDTGIIGMGVNVF